MAVCVTTTFPDHKLTLLVGNIPQQNVTYFHITLSFLILVFILSDFSETCESSSGSMSVSRCQLFEAGFPAGFLHLNDPSCKGTIRNGRVEFHFDNEEHICGTNLLVGQTMYNLLKYTIQTFIVSHRTKRVVLTDTNFCGVYI